MKLRGKKMGKKEKLDLRKKFVILHPVWNKYQKETTKNVDRNV